MNATLVDGMQVQIDEAGVEDIEAVIEFTIGLSPESRHDRYFAGPSTEALAKEVRREMSDERNISLVARSPADGRIVGHALAAYIDPDRAELAFAVADDVQHHGLGKKLLEAIVETLRSRGVHHFEATVLAENRAMRALFAAAGFKLTASAGSVQANLDEL